MKFVTTKQEGQDKAGIPEGNTTKPHIHNRYTTVPSVQKKKKSLDNHILYFLKMRVLSLTQDLKVNIHPHYYSGSVMNFSVN